MQISCIGKNQGGCKIGFEKIFNDTPNHLGENLFLLVGGEIVKGETLYQSNIGPIEARADKKTLRFGIGRMGQEIDFFTIEDIKEGIGLGVTAYVTSHENADGLELYEEAHIGERVTAGLQLKAQLLHHESVFSAQFGLRGNETPFDATSDLTMYAGGKAVLQPLLDERFVVSAGLTQYSLLNTKDMWHAWEAGAGLLITPDALIEFTVTNGRHQWAEVKSVRAGAKIKIKL